MTLEEIQRTFLAGMQQALEGQAQMIEAFNAAMALAQPKATQLRPSFGAPVPKPMATQAGAGERTDGRCDSPRP